MPTTDIDGAMKNMLKVSIMSGRVDPFVLNQLFPDLDMPSIVSTQELVSQRNNEADAMAKMTDYEAKAQERIDDINQDIMKSEMKMRDDSVSNIISGLMSERQESLKHQGELENQQLEFQNPQYLGNNTDSENNNAG